MDDLNLDDLDNIQGQAEEKLKVKNRFEQLSEKVISTSRERDDAVAKANAEAEARSKAEKDAEFYKDFSSNVTKYPNASEYQDKILEKVRGGYSTEDAMVAVLAKEGKLNYQAPEPVFNGQVAGGSAATSFEGNKTLDSMSTEEKFAALRDADASGDLVNALRGR